MENQLLSVEELKEEFNSKKEASRTAVAANGIADALEALSRALSGLRDAGVDVRLQIGFSGAEDAFSLIKKVEEIPGGVRYFLDVSGILKIGSVERLLAITTSTNVDAGNKTFKICVSSRDYVSRRLFEDFRGECFDLKDDPLAIAKFQKFVIDIAAGEELIHEHDVRGVLNKDLPQLLVKGSASPLTRPPRPPQP